MSRPGCLHSPPASRLTMSPTSSMLLLLLVAAAHSRAQPQNLLQNIGNILGGGGAR